jgi:MFS family permease
MPSLTIPYVLKNENITRLWFSKLLSQFTVNTLIFLVMVRVFEGTGSAIATAFVWIAYALPSIIIGPFAVSFVDTVNKQKVLYYTNILQALIMFIFALVSEANIFTAYTAVFTYSFVNQFFIPAELASLPVITPKKHYADANGIFLLTQQAGIMFGFGAGSFLIKYLGFQTSYLATSVLLIFAATSVAGLPKLTSQAPDKEFEQNLGSYFKSIVEGIKFIKSSKYTTAPFMLLVALQVSVAIISTSLPSVATTILGVPASAGGIYAVVPVGVGAIVATYAVPRLLRKKSRKLKIINASLFLIGTTIWTSVGVLPYLQGPPKLLAAFTLFAITSFGFVGALIPAQTFIQETTPHHLLGRVFGNFVIVSTAATIVPVVFSATIIDIFGVHVLFFLLGLTSFIALTVSKKYFRAKLEP